MLSQRRLPKFSLLPFATRMAILRRQSLLLAFLALLGSLGSAAFAWQFVAPLRAGSDMSDWVEVPSEILESHAIETTDTGIVALFFPKLAGVLYSPWIRYGYRFEGMHYVGIALSPAEETYSSLEGAEARLSLYRTGTSLHCLVNPESPRESVMSRHVVPASFQLAWLVGAAVLAGANIPLVRKRRQMRRSVRQERRFATYLEDTQPDQNSARFSDLRNNLSFELTTTSGDLTAGEGSSEDANVPSPLSGPSLVNKIIEDALGASATEVHLQTRELTANISYRIAGMLRAVLELPEESVDAFREELGRLSKLTGPDADSTALSVNHDGQQYALRAVSETLPWGERTTLYLSPLSES